MVKYNDETRSGWKFWKKRRYIVALLAFLGFFTSYILRVNLSVAIVAMTAVTKVVDENGIITYKQEFNWDSKIQGYVLSSFFYGYISTQLLGGWLAARIGGKRVFGIGIAVTAFFTIITPPLVKISVYLLIALRIIEGICEGVTYPCIHAIWANWAPPLERSKLATIAFSGSFFGTVFAMPVAGLMAEHIGWPSIFYIFGAIGLIWFVCWWIVVKDKPEDDAFISMEELEYITATLSDDEKKEKIIHPWKAMFTSPPVWAIVAAHFSENWGFYTMLTQLPTFMKDVLDFKLDTTGYLSALPYLVMTLVVQFSGQLADCLRTRKILTTTQVRKIFNCGAFLFQTVFMIYSAFISTPIGVVMCITLAVGLGGFAWSGFGVNHLDIAPQHASVLMGIGNTVATLPGIISPIITGYIVQNKKLGLTSQNVFMLRKFDTIRRDRQNRPGRGVAILISHDIKYHKIQVHFNCNNKIETCAVELLLSECLRMADSFHYCRFNLPSGSCYIRCICVGRETKMGRSTNKKEIKIL
ncbi:sialin isoform X2 [Monomorium pharaonis]|uniref:sialin isoform X2 n=1 Tax=Monomorium pharaonis TaxID=307658 RepID=UPI001747CE40|nr:sialin isoform X2 [Monomorium pharaonis]